MKKAILTIIIASVVAVSCKKQPDAMFTVDDSTPKTNQSIAFTNTSVDGMTYHWDFGDGTTSASENPIHTYTEAGTYTVSLTAYSKKEKKSDAETLSIVVSNTFEEMTNAERMMGLWDYVQRETKMYEDGELVGVETYLTASDFDIATMTFKDLDVLELRTDGDIETLEWFITNDEVGLFSINGGVNKIMEISETDFTYYNSTVEEIGDVTHRDSTFYTLNR